MDNVLKTFIASASELQSSDLYMTIKATQFTVPSANLNGVRCTAEFMNEIVEHQDKYVGLPLCADTVNQVQGRYSKLGHCYNPKTGVYSSSIIGSFYRFEKEELENGEMALVGYARVMKRNKRVCKAIGELFAENAQKFSFEISCGTYTTLDDDTILIDAADNNFIEGMCIVSFPACPEAVALDLVAEINGIGKEADEMIDVIESAESTGEVEAIEPIAEAADKSNSEISNLENVECETVVAEIEESISEPQDVVEEMEHSSASIEDSVNEGEEIVSETESENIDSESVNASVYVTTETVVRETTSVHDPETCISVHETNIHEIRIEEVVEAAELEIETAETSQENSEHHDAAAEQAVAEQEVAAEQEVVAEQEIAVAEETADDTSSIIADLQASIAALRKELNELRAEHIAAEEKADRSAESINPFVAEISAPKKYTLLDSERSSSNNYSLLEKA